MACCLKVCRLRHPLHGTSLGLWVYMSSVRWLHRKDCLDPAQAFRGGAKVNDKDQNLSLLIPIPSFGIRLIILSKDGVPTIRDHPLKNQS